MHYEVKIDRVRPRTASLYVADFKKQQGHTRNETSRIHNDSVDRDQLEKSHKKIQSCSINPAIINMSLNLGRMEAPELIPPPVQISVNTQSATNKSKAIKEYSRF